MSEIKVRPVNPDLEKGCPWAGAIAGRKEFGGKVIDLINGIGTTAVILIHARWGQGKSLFARQLDKDERSGEVFIFDAYSSDYYEDPFDAFSDSILEQATGKLGSKLATATGMASSPKSILGRTRAAAGRVKRTLRESAFGGGFMALASVAASLTDPGVAGDATDMAVKYLASKLAALKPESAAMVDEDVIASFRDKLGKLVEVIRGNDPKPLTIIVDELDRCRPEFAVELLQRIKHMFQVKGVVFVLMVNRAQLEKYIGTFYGQPSPNDERDTSISFLEKLCDIELCLPYDQGLSIEATEACLSDRKPIIEGYLQNFGFVGRVDEERTIDVEQCVFIADYFSRLFGASMREVQRAIVSAAYVKRSRKFTEQLELEVCLLVAFLRMKNPALCNECITNSNGIRVVDRHYRWLLPERFPSAGDDIIKFYSTATQLRKVLDLQPSELQNPDQKLSYEVRENPRVFLAMRYFNGDTKNYKGQGKTILQVIASYFRELSEV